MGFDSAPSCVPSSNGGTWTFRRATPCPLDVLLDKCPRRPVRQSPFCVILIAAELVERCGDVYALAGLLDGAN